METTNDLLPTVADANERFRTIRELGSGTYGRVVLALDRELQQRCALKILQKSTTKYRDFHREYNYSIVLSAHRSIINTFAGRCFQTADAYIIVQEYAPLGDLFESIPPQRGLPERAVKTIMKQVASALEFMHEQGLVHRDVKPENIMIFDADFRKVKLIDFGMTRRCGSYVRRLIGSIPYSPPEVCDAHSNDILVSSSMDVWAFGVLLFCSLTGNFPWEHAQESDVYYNEYLQWLRHHQMQSRYKLPSQWYKFSSRLMRIFRKMLDPDPLKRCEIIEISKYYDDRWINDQFNSHRRSSNEDEGVEEDFSSSGSGTECNTINSSTTSNTDFEELTQLMRNSLTGFDNLLTNDNLKSSSSAATAKTCC
ncbi:unnamed protein product [Adineta ricciae]|uniref:Protein kinase domain-containing protein n=1 Tax=Adineta ricciae TaxID=249248 RepID=A0A813RT40_ADIRI|nr:unnamed protein product [Adineta ricciae]CAF1627065.1 unnamed protein product [Adineta ricciae]